MLQEDRIKTKEDADRGLWLMWGLRMWFVGVLLVVGICGGIEAREKSFRSKHSFTEDSCVAGIFKSYQLKGGFILQTPKNQMIFNHQRVFTRFVPASTFKIFHTLIGLDLGLVNPDGLFFHYEGEKLAMKQWERDMTIKDAIRFSNVPAFVNLARNIGYERMKAGITKLKFGNQDIGKVEDLQSFWLKGPLKISPFEMSVLLGKLARSELDFSQESQMSVIEMLEQDLSSGIKIATKTGLSETSEGRYGWIVGWITLSRSYKKSGAGSVEGRSYDPREMREIIPFALHLDYPIGLDYALRQKVLDEILKKCVDLGRNGLES